MGASQCLLNVAGAERPQNEVPLRLQKANAGVVGVVLGGFRQRRQYLRLDETGEVARVLIEQAKVFLLYGRAVILCRLEGALNILRTADDGIEDIQEKEERNRGRHEYRQDARKRQAVEDRVSRLRQPIKSESDGRPQRHGHSRQTGTRTNA